jgi:hypothetical protein
LPDYEQAERLIAVLLDRTEPDASLLRIYAAVHEQLGELAQARGELTSAGKHYSTALVHMEARILSRRRAFTPDSVRQTGVRVSLPLSALPCRECSTHGTVARLLALYASVSPAEGQWAVAPAASLFESAYKRQDATPGDLRDYARWMLEWSPEGQHDPKMALQLAQRAATMTNHKDASILRVLALAAHRCGDSTTAVEIQRKVVNLRPWDSSANETLKAYVRASP